MAFFKFKMIFSEENDLSGITKKEKGEIIVNTNHICAFNENSESKHTMLRMSNGEVYPCPIPIKEFEGWLGGIEMIESLPTVTDN